MFCQITRLSRVSVRHGYVVKGMHALNIIIAEINVGVLKNLNTGKLCVKLVMISKLLLRF